MSIKTLGERIKECRSNIDLTQAKLGDKLDKKGSTVRMWELGKSSPDPETLIKMADLFGCSVDYLLGRDPIPNIEVRNMIIEEINQMSKIYNDLDDREKAFFTNVMQEMFAINKQFGFSAEMQAAFYSFLDDLFIQIKGLTRQSESFFESGDKNIHDIAKYQALLETYRKPLHSMLDDILKKFMLEYFRTP